MEIPANKILSPSELSFFCMQIAMILKSGMLVSDGIDWMHEDIKEGNVKDALHYLKNKLSEKVPLYVAMKNSGYFPSYIVNMSQIGSITGKLEDVMLSLSEYYERERLLKEKIRNSVFYPAMLFIMMSFIIILLVTKIFPIFEGMLEKLGASSNDSSSLSFNKGIMAGRISMILVIIIIAVIAFIYILYRSEKGKKNLNMFLSNFALTKSIMKKITAYRFSSAMSLLLNSGMNVDNSIDILLDIAEEPVFKENIKLCKDSMKSGDSFLDSINKLSLFSSMHMQMLHMGEKIGEMDVVMNKLTDIYENEAEQAISNTVSLIEPVLVGILSVLTGVILISVMLPLMNIMSSIG